MNRSAIAKAVSRLTREGYIRVGNFNRMGYDRTRWFAINTEVCSSLKSIQLTDPRVSPSETDLFPSETTIPQTSSQISEVNIHTTMSRIRAARMTDRDIDERFDELFLGLKTRLPKQPKLFETEKKKRAKVKYVEPIPVTMHKLLYRVCYLAETVQEVQLLSASQKGKVATALSNLQKANVNLGKINQFEIWWHSNWKSRDRATKEYQAPRPEQIVEHWSEAMKSHAVKKPLRIEIENTDLPARVTIEEIMKRRALDRHK